MRYELIPGIDRPRRGQYVLGMLFIALLATVGYFYRRSVEPRPGPGIDATPSSVSPLTRSPVSSACRLCSSLAIVASTSSWWSGSNCTAYNELFAPPSTRVAFQDSACPT